MMKAILIPVAAFAVTATGVSAFNAEFLEDLDLDLTDSQIETLEEVHELKEAGADREEIKEVLEDAGIEREDLRAIRAAVREARSEIREAVRTAIEDEDYDAYLDAVADSPRANVIDSEADFDLLVEAYELREAGDTEGAREIMEELGFEKPEKRGERMERGGAFRSNAN